MKFKFCTCSWGQTLLHYGSTVWVLRNLQQDLLHVSVLPRRVDQLCDLLLQGSRQRHQLDKLTFWAFVNLWVIKSVSMSLKALFPVIIISDYIKCITLHFINSKDNKCLKYTQSTYISSFYFLHFFEKVTSTNLKVRNFLY